MIGVAAMSRIGAAQSAPRREILYNGITLGSPWPPRWSYPGEHPAVPPYLASPPRVIPIDLGRQLFVDDFLIQETTMARHFHRPTFHPASPVVRPDRPWEQQDQVSARTGGIPIPAAMVFSDGVFYDQRDRLFKMWYMAGYTTATSLAISEDGVTWQKPVRDVVAGTNIVLNRHRDSTTVWIDPYEPDPRARYKMSLSHGYLALLISPDGVHWTEIGRTGPTGDRTTFFYNPFRKKWVFSVRADQFEGPISGRYRRYWESTDFRDAPTWNGTEPVAWIKADSKDVSAPGIRLAPELYNLDCVAYESVLLGLFSIWRGEPDDREKINEVTVGFSRDGFHWERPDRGAFLPVAAGPGAWNWANVQSAGGCCVIVGDQLYFYASGREGRPGTNAPGVCSTGLATLRRDGFASMAWFPDEMPVRRQEAAYSDEGRLTTRPVVFSGGHLFVNADVTGGELRVEVLDTDGRVIAPFTRDRCDPMRGDSTKHPVRWTGGALTSLAGREVRLRFSMSRGRLFAFWVSASASGESGGYVAAGGPQFSSDRDTSSRSE
jgi:hypothetical protein